MNRGQVIARFREECPEITTRTISDAVLQSWCIVGEHEVCAKARLIKGDKTFPSIIGIDAYDLTDKIAKFYDIDDLPGSGVIYDNDQLTKTSAAELDQLNESWRDNSNGTPDKYFRRGKFLNFEQPPDAVVDIQVYTILVSDDWNDDNIDPFNQLSYYEPHHYVMVLYLIMRAKSKVGKPQEKADAKAEYKDYVDSMKEVEDRGDHSAIQLKPKQYYSTSSHHHYR